MLTHGIRHVVLAIQLFALVGCGQAVNMTSETDTSLKASVDEEAAEAQTRTRKSNESFWAAIRKARNDFPEAVLYIQPGTDVPPIDPGFTLEEQQRIDQHRGERVIVIVEIVDAYRVGSEYRLVCQNIFGRIFILDCEKEDVDRILALAKGDEFYWNRTFAIVCKLAATRVAYERHRYAEVTYEAEESYEDSEAELREEGLHPRVYVTGQCDAVVHIRGFDLFVDWEDVVPE